MAISLNRSCSTIPFRPSWVVEMPNLLALASPSDSGSIPATRTTSEGVGQSLDLDHEIGADIPRADDRDGGALVGAHSESSASLWVDGRDGLARGRRPASTRSPVAGAMPLGPRAPDKITWPAVGGWPRSLAVWVQRRALSGSPRHAAPLPCRYDVAVDGHAHGNVDGCDIVGQAVADDEESCASVVGDGVGESDVPSRQSGCPRFQGIAQDDSTAPFTRVRSSVGESRSSPV